METKTTTAWTYTIENAGDLACEHSWACDEVTTLANGDTVHPLICRLCLRTETRTAHETTQVVESEYSILKAQLTAKLLEEIP